MSPASIFYIAKNDLACYTTKRAAIFWTFLGPAFCMWLFGYFTPAATSLASVTVINHATSNAKSSRLIESLRHDGRIVNESNAPARSGFSVEIPASNGDSITIFAGPEDTNDERALRSEVQAAFTSPTTVSAAPETTSTGGFQRTVPAYLIMFMTMNLFVSGAGFAEERASGRLRRLLTSPVSSVSIVLGRLGSRVAIAWAQMLVLFATGVFVLHIHWAQHPVGLLLILSLYALAMGGVGILLGTLIDDPDQAQAFAMWLALLLAPLTGLWWPLELMPAPVAKLAELLPTGWAMQSVNALLATSAKASDFKPTIFGLIAVATVTILIASSRLRRALE